mmetsp:Transcript_22275/g.63930  ORF Transcript_22275/g.63930 Transcript_22275/m.63930 type:complete len:363 (+) Transcript_22275:122-1210(+)
MGAIGSMCVRDCVRSTHEIADDDVSVNTSTAAFPSSEPRAALGARAPLMAIGASGGEGGLGGAVPPVPNWSQVLRDADNASAAGARGGGSRWSGRGGGTDVAKETPRFDEVRASPRTSTETPRDAVGGEFKTPRPTPRDPQLGEGNEISYEGMYLGAMKHGQGKLRMTSSTYEGEFQNDVKHGLGKLTWDDGRRYHGGFQHDKFHGHAVMTWPDGRKYTGNYADDRKHGEGTFSWQDGRRYAGQWVQGKRHGVGVYTNAKGLTRRGTWQLDRPLAWELLSAAEEREPDEAAIAAAVDIAQSQVRVGFWSARGGVSADARPLESPQRVEVVPVGQASFVDHAGGADLPESQHELDIQVRVSKV